MDAEPQVESLMQLLNDALNELDNLDKRLTGYDNLLRVSWIELKFLKHTVSSKYHIIIVQGICLSAILLMLQFYINNNEY